MTFKYLHIAVEQYFASKTRHCQLLQSKIGSYNMTLGQVEEWLNNYTMLMNVWFCENLYYPALTNNKLWERNLYDKLRNGTIMSIDDIIADFDVKTLQNNGGLLIGVDELATHLSKYHALRSDRTITEIDTMTGQRMNLTLKIFNEQRKNNKLDISKALKKQYPFDPTMLVGSNAAISHVTISNDEHKRESELINYLLWFDGEVARPIFVNLGIISE